jgi:hypothetical protein
MNQKFKNFILVVAPIIILILSISLIRGIINRDKIYHGFLEPPIGAWSELKNDDKSIQRSVYIGENTVNGVPVYGVEVDLIDSQNEQVLLQIWRDKEKDMIVEVVSKLEGKDKVLCIDINLLRKLLPDFDSLMPFIKTPEAYSLNNKYSYDVFTTSTGKTIKIAKIIDKESNKEIWISSEIPFGIVKVIDIENGQVETLLQDFDLTGGVQKISALEMEDCQRVK